MSKIKVVKKCSEKPIGRPAILYGRSTALIKLAIEDNPSLSGATHVVLGKPLNFNTERPILGSPSGEVDYSGEIIEFILPRSINLS